MPGHYDFSGDKSGVRQGETFNRTLTWKDAANVAVDLTGYTSAMQVRKKAGDPDLIFEFSTVNGGIVLGGAAGTVGLAAASNLTAALPAGKYVYDLRVTSPGGVATYLLAGVFEVVASVTV